MGKDPRPRGASLAGHLPSRLLSRRPDSHQRPERHRSGAVGHQGQGPRRARSTNCWAARRATACGSTPTPSTSGDRSRRPGEKASPPSRPGVHGGAARHDIIETQRLCGHCAASAFAALREAARPRSRYRHRFPRRHPAADGQAAHQGAGALSAYFHRRARASARMWT